MHIHPTEIPDVLIIEPQVFADERGFFMEIYEARKFAAGGLTAAFVQDNHSGSRQGTLRGLHYQIRQAQGKLISVVAGAVFDVAVDLRKSSPTFGQWTGCSLSAENKLRLWIPPGFAHGFYVTSPWAEIIYKVTDFYAPEWERALLWNDPAVNITWPLVAGVPLSISKRDADAKRLSEIELFN